MSNIETFRQDVRRWLDANCPPRMRTPMPQDEMPGGGRRAQYKHPGHESLARQHGGKGLDRADVADEIRRRRSRQGTESGAAGRTAPHQRAPGAVRHGHQHDRPGVARVRHRRTESRTSAEDRARTRSGGARATANRTPAPISPASRRAPWRTATSTSSTARRSGRRAPITPTGSSVWCAPIRRRRSTTASRSSCSTSISPASPSNRSC